MKTISFIVAALSAPAVVVSACRNRDFGYGVFSRPCDCSAGYTIFENPGCSGRSVRINNGGWTTNSDNWPVRSYECDGGSSKDTASQCMNRRFGIGSFPKPKECAGGYTIFQSPGCSGQFVHFNDGGWTTKDGNWPVQAFRCDDVCDKRS
ncbi:hypothetical protein BGZ93_003668 [Podila epicladia]|nr:hypothetical protein BGZ93_003668 [Podila epicladia]